MFRAITLVQCPIHDLDASIVTPPLGLLTLSACLLRDGYRAQIVDLNILGLKNRGWVDGDSFFKESIEKILSIKPDVVGITSMALDSPLGIELAQNIKQKYPQISIVLGGPHFGSIAKELLDNYPVIDYVVCGEGEKPILELMSRGRASVASPVITNLAERTPFGVQLIRQTKSGIALDDLPFPAYELLNLGDYTDNSGELCLSYEHARGCNLRCSFCYSPVHWGQGEQGKSIEKISTEIKQLKRLGASSIFFVGDNFLNDSSRAIEICQAIQGSSDGVSFHGYATLAQLTDQVVKALSDAGFNTVFIGVDAVSDGRKKEFKKTYYKSWKKLKKTLSNCLQHGIKPTCALMLAPDSERIERELIIRTALKIVRLGCGVRINHMSYYNGTQLEADNQFRSIFHTSKVCDIVMDTPHRVSYSSIPEASPNLFPYHQRSVTESEEIELLTLIKISYIAIQAIPETLTRYMNREGSSLIDCFTMASEHVDLGYKSDPSDEINRVIKALYLALDKIHDSSMKSDFRMECKMMSYVVKDNNFAMID